MRLYITNVILNSFMTVPQLCSRSQSLHRWAIQPQIFRWTLLLQLNPAPPGMCKSPANIRNLDSKSSRILSTKSPTQATSWIVGEKLTCILNRPRFGGAQGVQVVALEAKTGRHPLNWKRIPFQKPRQYICIISKRNWQRVSNNPFPGMAMIFRIQYTNM